MSNYKLCYVDRHWAYFTTARLEDQWGDDWNDAPYEHNAGPPYDWEPHRDMPKYSIRKLAHYSELDTPADIAGLNSNYSVQAINSGATPWLYCSCYYKDGEHHEDHVRIYAGASIEEFKEAVWKTGGEVYEESLAPNAQPREKVAYLAGPMEFAEDYGMGWRERIREGLKSLGIRCILPNEEEAKFISGQGELNEIKKYDPQRYVNIMRQFIKQDLQFVESVDMIVTCWNGERMSGTIGEATYAYLKDQVSYLITNKTFEQIPGWFAACYTKIFYSEDAFLDFMRTEYGKEA